MVNSGDYSLLDFGHGRKLERFGELVVERPAPQATNKPLRSNWQPDWLYSGERVSDGEWIAQRDDLPTAWAIEMAGQAMHCRLGQGGQVGIYPEHMACWQWLQERLAGCTQLKVLNLFAGTGGATQAAVLAGAEVTHVDAQASQLELARLNVGDRGARFIRENVMTYVERMLRKGERYDLVIMDPPSFGRAGKGKAWDIRADLESLVELLPGLVTPTCRGIWISFHTPDISLADIASGLSQRLHGEVQTLQLGTVTQEGRVLEAGVAATWQPS